MELPSKENPPHSSSVVIVTEAGKRAEEGKQQKPVQSVRNQRFLYMSHILLNDNSGRDGPPGSLYFSDEAMRSRSPALYELYIGKYLSYAEKRAYFSSAYQKLKLPLADMLLRQVDEREVMREKEEQHEEEEEEEEGEEEERLARKKQLREDFIDIMKDNFLNGRDYAVDIDGMRMVGLDGETLRALEVQAMQGHVDEAPHTLLTTHISLPANVYSVVDRSCEAMGGLGDIAGGGGNTREDEVLQRQAMMDEGFKQVMRAQMREMERDAEDSYFDSESPS
eukprot:Nk52_evm21s151 gene=Nk52_evmTU21s151